MIYVNYGCGLCALEDWSNYDGSPRQFLENTPIISQILGLWQDLLFPKNVKYGDSVKGLPLKPNSANAVYSSHVLEHISRQDIEYALINTNQLLRPGSVFRFAVPDIEWRKTKYLSDREKNPTEAADKFIESCNICTRKSARGIVGKLRAAYSHSGHNWMYDFGTMSRLLFKVSFIEVNRCAIGDSGDRMFDAVEVNERFYKHGEAELAVQARKL